MRSRKALANVIASLLLQVIAVICGFVMPRLIIGAYGSSVNGLLSTIGQSLGYIALLEAGVGGVVRSTLYKPLAIMDVISISRILKSAEKFFRVIACIFIAYLLVLAVVLPYIVGSEFDYAFTSTLVLIIGVMTFAEYFFGITYQVLLQADQRLYITSILQMITTVAVTITAVILIRLGASIHTVKLCSAAIYIIKPLALYVHVKRRYGIVRDCQEDSDALKQRWDGFGHHIAYTVQNNTDILVLTLFTNLREVSVYSIYMIIGAGVRNLTTTFSSGMEAAFGDMIAKGEDKTLRRSFGAFELLSFSMATILFTSTALTISPFVRIYTKGILDVDYYRPLFGYIFVAAQAIYCIRLPYHFMVIAAGHFKQTRNGAMLEAGLNILLSIVFVSFYGLVGVAIGTLCAVAFRTVQYAVYLSYAILNRGIREFLKKVVIYAACVVITISIIHSLPPMVMESYSDWLAYLSLAVCAALVTTLVAGSLFYLDDMRYIYRIAKRMVHYQPKTKAVDL